MKKHVRKSPNKGWRGDPLGHSFAARGIVKPKNYPYASLEEIILADLEKAQRPLTAREISKRTNIAWDSVMKYLYQLENKGKIRSLKSNTRTLWESA